ncbi:MAG: 50S ribosomal protein L1 [Planctomycetes bacterium]|nr:50S ribosomal protein L1 [Planctomycetota bacterium]
MKQHSRRYNTAAGLRDIKKRYGVPEAVQILKAFPDTKFDETIEVVMSLGIDPRHSDQQVRGTVSLPHGTGKSVRILVFAEGEAAEQARAAGAEFVGAADLAKKIEGGWSDFDIAIAPPGMMKVVGKLGKVLGPQGKMPSPKSGTVTDDVAKAVSEFKAGKIEYRNDKGGNVAAPVGRKSFQYEQIVENVEAFLNHIKAAKPPGAKGGYIRKAVLTTTMNPGILLAV